MKIIPCLEDSYSCLYQQIGVHFDSVLQDHRSHHHRDHDGGNDEMKRLVPKIKVYGGIYDNVLGCTNKVKDGDKILLGLDTKISCILTPCHTKGHTSYYVTGKEAEKPAVFTGDTMFVAGCGKFFEGTAHQMYQSLCMILGSLPKSTRVYCGHEVASAIEPENEKIAQKLIWAKHERLQGLPTVPSTIAEEWGTNPFLRVDIPELQEKVGRKSAVEALQEIRQWKDNWKG